MPDIKISDLTAASSASGAMQLEVNDSGSSKRVTVDQIKAYMLSAGSISATELGTDAVTTIKIAASAVTAAKIADSAITPSKLSTGAPTWDSSGNVGLGVTPSTWSLKAIQGPNAELVFAARYPYMASNCTYNSGWYRTNAEAAATYVQAAGQHIWNVAPTGTVGSAITFTQAMTLDANANLALGTSSSGGTFYLLSPTGGYNGPAIVGQPNGTLKWQVGTSSNIVGDGSTDLALYGASGVGIRFYTNGGNERMRLDASGNLLVGTTTASSKLTASSNAGGSDYNSGQVATFLTGGNTNNPNGRGLVASFGAGGVGDPANTYGASITIGASSVGSIAIQNKPSAAFAIADFFPNGTYVGAGNAPTERMSIDGSGNLKFNSGYGSAATAYGCRAWVNFNGTGTVAIRASGNVSSITDNGVGNYTINLTNAMPDNNYNTHVDTQGASTGSIVGETGIYTASTNTFQNPTSSAFRITTWNSAVSGLADTTYVMATVFR